MLPDERSPCSVSRPLALTRLPHRHPYLLIDPLPHHLPNLVDPLILQDALDLPQQPRRGGLDARAQGRDGVEEGTEGEEVREVVRDAERGVLRGGGVELREEGEAGRTAAAAATLWCGAEDGAFWREQARDDLVEVEGFEAVAVGA